MGWDKWGAGLIVLICALMLIRLALSAPRRARVDAWLRRLPHAPKSWRARWLRLRHARQHRQDAERLAEEAIQRARRNQRKQVDKDGNVLRPDAFKGPRKPH
ncbi:MAG: hypothetical protein I8H88_06335 [Burkholderiales bacterium]|nr:hypothetical protein [Burkholderiales bacterium]